MIKVKVKTHTAGLNVTDVNGTSRLKNECISVSQMVSHDKMETRHYFTLGVNTPPPDAGIYHVRIGNEDCYTNNTAVWIPQLGQWVNNLVTRVYQGYYKTDGKVIMGNMILVPFYTVISHDNRRGEILIENHALATELGYVPSKNTYLYYKKDQLSGDDLRRLQHKAPYELPIRTTHHANSANESYVLLKERYDKSKVHSAKYDKFFARLLGGKTYGLEYETTQGNVPMPMLSELGMVPLIDGSIGRGNYEYTTIPLGGAKGASTVKKQCEALTEFSGVGNTCAFHVHVGNVATDRLTLVALYALCHRLENEMYSIMPYYKQHEVAVMSKQKEYSRRLPNLNLANNTIFKCSESYNVELDAWNKKIFEFMACKETSPMLNRGNKGENVLPWREKWHCPTRYYWVNFINYLLGSSGTIEFRIHEPTTNFTKVSAFLLLVTSIIRYAEKYPKKILLYKDKIQLKDIVAELETNFGEIKEGSKTPFATYAKLASQYLAEYITRRQTLFEIEGTSAMKQAVGNEGNAFARYAKLANNFINADPQFNFVSSFGWLTLY